jgi:hypothetical protein
MRTIPVASCSREYHSVFLVDQVLVETPRDDAAKTFACDTGKESSEEACCSVGLVDLHECIRQRAVVLRLVLVVVLEVDSSADQVKGVSDHTACGISKEHRQRGYDC